MDPLLERARASAGDATARRTSQLRELVRLWVEHVVAHRDHMLVFQQERHVIESGERWREVRASRKAFERLVGGSLARAIGRDGPDEPAARCWRCWDGQPHRPVVPPPGALTSEQIADGYVDLVVQA